MYSFGVLEGERVRLDPVTIEHAALLFERNSPEIWDHYPIRIESLADMEQFVRKAISGRESGEQYPFAVFDKESGQYVGSTRYLRISTDNNNLNIGSTWYTPQVWRTRVNTETKYLLLKHAFESLRVCRVEIVTSTDNVRSQAAIERLGAKREGLLRKKYYGLDYYIYGLLDEEWAATRDRLERYLEGGRRWV